MEKLQLLVAEASKRSSANHSIEATDEEITIFQGVYSIYLFPNPLSY